jgi:hypothetical protein
MDEPVFFVSHFRIKEGSLDPLRSMTRESAARLEAEKPRTVLFLSFINPDASVISYLHAFTDAESMDVHFVGAEERALAAYEHLEALGWEVYGKPSPSAIEALHRAASTAGVTVTLHPEFAAGFLRLKSGG